MIHAQHTNKREAMLCFVFVLCGSWIKSSSCSDVERMFIVEPLFFLPVNPINPVPFSCHSIEPK